MYLVRACAANRLSSPYLSASSPNVSVISFPTDKMKHDKDDGFVRTHFICSLALRIEAIIIALRAHRSVSNGFRRAVQYYDGFRLDLWSWWAKSEMKSKAIVSWLWKISVTNSHRFAHISLLLNAIPTRERANNERTEKSKTWRWPRHCHGFVHDDGDVAVSNKVAASMCVIGIRHHVGVFVNSNAYVSGLCK